MFKYSNRVCVVEIGLTSLFICGRVKNSIYFDSCMSGVACSCPGSSCKSVLLDDAEVSVLERYKSSFMSSVVVAGGAVLSVCVCTASSACSIVMAL